MRELFTKEELSSFTKAISSEFRVDILQYIAQNPGISLMELAEKFDVSRAAITQNVKILTEAGLLEIGKGSVQGSGRKGCYLSEDKFLLNIRRHILTQKIYSTEIPIGQYSDYSVTPTCGIATPNELIGAADDPAFFDDPKRFNASILWFTTGFVEYRLPNYLKKDQKVEELQFSFEVSSEAPGSAENWPSDLTFSLNGTELGLWTSPGDYGNVRGRYTPEWWEINWNQYGLLKLLSISDQGTFIDGRMISPLKLSDLNLDYRSELRFRISALKGAQNEGGCTIFGRDFGNYNQGLKFNLIYTEKSDKEDAEEKETVLQ